MGSITDIFQAFLGAIEGFVSTGSTAADGFLETGSTAAGDIFDTVTGSIEGIGVGEWFHSDQLAA